MTSDIEKNEFIHTTIGVYPNGEYKVNGVRSSNLAHHIQYNLTFRYGRALYVDGLLIYKGNLSPSLIKEWGNPMFNLSGKAQEIHMDKDTAPYV